MLTFYLCEGWVEGPQCHRAVVQIRARQPREHVRNSASVLRWHSASVLQCFSGIALQWRASVAGMMVAVAGIVADSSGRNSGRNDGGFCASVAGMMVTSVFSFHVPVRDG